MYNSFYNLTQNPFRLSPDPAWLYMTARHREALAGLVYSVCNRSGLTVLVGEAGTGKTTLLHALTEWLPSRRFVAAFCTNPTLTREEFFDLLLTRLEIECSSTLKSRQLIALEQGLPRYHTEGRRPVLIVDEAHQLSPALLEEIRLLLNLENSKEKFLDIVLAGQPELIHVLGRPELRQLKQRVSCYCRVGPLTHAETKEYVNHRLTQAGLQQQALFPEDTIDTIYQYTGGIPRLVNSLCDSSLNTGFGLQAQTITVAIVREAAKDLDLLIDDTPHTVSTGASSVASVAAAAAAAAGAIDTAPLVAPRVVIAATSTVSAAQPTPAPVPFAPTASLPFISVPITPAALAAAAAGSTASPAASEQPEQPARKEAVVQPAASTPLEGYASRQKSLGFLASLVARWT